VTPSLQAFSYYRVDLGTLPRKNQKLLGVPSDGVIEDLFDVGWRVDVGLMGGEGAVLAVALAGPGEGEGVVPDGWRFRRF
jgi:hypothetical protein